MSKYKIIGQGDKWTLRGAFDSLKFGLCYPVARMAKSDEVIQVIGGLVVTIKKTEWYFVMNNQGLPKFITALFLGQLAPLTGVVVSPERLSPLRVPVRAMPVDFITVDVVRGVLTLPMLITAWPGAIFAGTPVAIRLIGGYVKLAMTVKALSCLSALFLASSGLILTFRRAMLTPAMSEARPKTGKLFSAVIACQVNAAILFIGQISAYKATVFGLIRPIRFDLERLATDQADKCNHFNLKMVTPLGRRLLLSRQHPIKPAGVINKKSAQMGYVA